MDKVTTFDAHNISTVFLSLIVTTFNNCLSNKENLDDLREIVAKKSKLLFEVFSRFQNSGAEPGVFKVEQL